MKKYILFLLGLLIVGFIVYGLELSSRPKTNSNEEIKTSSDQDSSQATDNSSGTDSTDEQFVRTDDIMFALSPQAPTPPSKGTLYSLKGMQVMQSAKNGVLMNLIPMGQDQEIIGFLYTDKNLVDGVRLDGYWASFVGTYQYETIFGVQKNIYAFKMVDKNQPQAIAFIQQKMEIQQNVNDTLAVQSAAQQFVRKRLQDNCVQYWSNAAQNGGSRLFTLFNSSNSTLVCMNESVEFSPQPTVTKIGERRWTVSSYVEGRDDTLPNQISMIHVSFIVDLTILANGQPMLNDLKFFNKESKRVV